MNLKYKKAKSICLIIILFLYSFIIFNLCASDLLAQNQDCPSCPNKEEQKAQQDQPKAKEHMVGDIKVIEIPSKYSREELEKMFPVPDQWKKWYQLEKEGNLPKYIKLYDVKAKYIKYNCMNESKCIYKRDYLANILLFSKNLCEKFDDKTVNKLLSIVAEGGNYGWSHFYNELYYNPYLSTSIIPLLFKGLEAKNGLPASLFQDRIYDQLQNFRLHPLFFKDELDTLEKNKQDFWKLYRDANKLATNQSDISILQITAINSLYLLDEEIDKLISIVKHNNFQGDVFSFSQLYYDPVNNYEIVFNDYRLKPLYDWMNKEMPLNKWAAFRYFSLIGEGENHIDEMIEYCRQNFNRKGLEVFKLLAEFKNQTKVKKLIIYYNNNKNKFSNNNGDLDNYNSIIRSVYYIQERTIND